MQSSICDTLLHEQLLPISLPQNTMERPNLRSIPTATRASGMELAPTPRIGIRNLIEEQYSEIVICAGHKCDSFVAIESALLPNIIQPQSFAAE